MGGRLPIQQKDRRRSYIDRLQKNLSQWWQTLSRPLQSSNLTNVNERKGTTYISTSSCLRSEQKPLINYDSDSEVRIFGCFVLDPCGSACCATSLNQRYPRISSTRYLQHLLLHAWLHLTLLVHLLNREGFQPRIPGQSILFSKEFKIAHIKHPIQHPTKQTLEELLDNPQTRKSQPNKGSRYHRRINQIHIIGKQNNK
ncbi:unnamed protein product [Lupinus luteus]|uniref:Uncharacterized protein n=1 Tax=Lupinus luteus TaxID=3873 RepID=A0AAV1YAV8_LUPLU